jgi:ankyrin repeat protein
MWRVRAEGVCTTNGAWDVHGLEFLDASGNVIEGGTAVDSDNCQNQGYHGYTAANALDRSTSLFWGGRNDANRQLWIGASFPSPVEVRGVRVQQKQGGASCVAVEFSDSLHKGDYEARRKDLLSGWTTVGTAEISIRNEDFQDISLAQISPPVAERSKEADAFLAYLVGQQKAWRALEPAKVEAALKAPGVASTVGNDGLSALHVAALNNYTPALDRLAIFRAFAAAGADLDAKDAKGRSALVLAASQFQDKSVAALMCARMGEERFRAVHGRLIAQGERENAENGAGGAARAGPNTLIAGFWKPQRETMRCKENEDECIAHFEAELARMSPDDFAAAVNHCNVHDWGNNCLHRCCYHGHDRALVWLIQHGADVNAQSVTHGDYPLHRLILHAQKSGTNGVRTIEILLENGANPGLENHFGETPLAKVLASKEYKEGRSSSRACARTFIGTMVPFAQVEAAVGPLAKLSDASDQVEIGRPGSDADLGELRTAAERLLALAFGPEPERWARKAVFRYNDAGKLVVVARDALQPRHQVLVGRETSDAEGARRSALFVGLAVRLLALAGQRALDGHLRTLCSYLLVNHVSDGAELDAALRDAATGALSRLRSGADEVYAGLERLPTLTKAAKVRFGSGVGKGGASGMDATPTGGSASEDGSARRPHQREAHRALSWIEGQVDTIEACAALVENGAVDDIPAFCLWVDKLNPDRLAAAFQLGVYRRWLLGEARQVDREFQQTLVALDLPGASVRAGPLKAEKRVEDKQIDYSSFADVDPREKAKEMLELKCGESMQDRMCAGGVLDLCRASVVFADEAGMAEGFKRIMECENLEPVRVKNGFHASVNAARAHGYRDVKICSKVTLPSQERALICEIQLILEPLLKLKKYQHECYNVTRGDYFA